MTRRRMTKRVAVLLTAVLLIVLIAVQWAPWAGPDEPEQYTGPPVTLIEASYLFEEEYGDLPGVNSISINFERSRLQITAYTEEEADYLLEVVPKTFMGHPVAVCYVLYWWLSSSQVQDHQYPAVSPSTIDDVSDERYNLIRPLIGGIATTAGQPGGGSNPGEIVPFIDSLGSGTLGLITNDNKILTCGHVIAVNLQLETYLPMGTHVYQPTKEYSNRVGKLGCAIVVSGLMNLKSEGNT